MSIVFKHKDENSIGLLLGKSSQQTAITGTNSQIVIPQDEQLEIATQYHTHDNRACLLRYVPVEASP